MNSRNSKTSDPHRLLLNLSDKMNLKNCKSIFFIISQHLLYTEKYKKSHIRTINLKYQLEHGMKEFELPDALYTISDIQDFFEYIFKKYG